MRWLVLWTVLCCVLCDPALSAAQHISEKREMQVFETLPVLDEGRIKPLGSFARVKLKSYAGQDHLGSLSAMAWLAMSLFDPAQAGETEIFAIPDPLVRAQLGLKIRKNLYSFLELKAGLDQTAPHVAVLLEGEEKDWTAQDRALIALHDKVTEYLALLRSFSLLLPLDIVLPEHYHDPALKAPWTFLALVPLEKKLEKDLKRVIARKGDRPERYAPSELQLAQAAFQIRNVRMGGAHNTILRVIPDSWSAPPSGAKDQWYTPWEVVLGGHGSPATERLFDKWQAVAESYRQHNAGQWDVSVEALRKESMAQGGLAVDPFRLKTENIYRTVQPYTGVVALYGLAFVLFCFPVMARWGFVAGWLGVAGHGLAIASRIYILGRPPVGTLYESVLFVSVICAVCALVFGRRATGRLAFLSGMMSAAGLLMVAPVILPQGDTLEVLVAVLNTNFWLGTHVICITIGYAVCIFTAVLAHFALLMPQENLKRVVHVISLAALSFMAVGTVLGGIWADQSWGRFWGWDPKENGALLIVLWLVWAQHGRLTGRLGPAGFLVVMALTNVIVAISWFGVNLLGVGLHSYGFTSGLAGGLAVFCAGEFVLIGGLYAAVCFQKKKESLHAA